MKIRFLLSLAILLAASATFAQDLPLPSPPATLQQQVGLTDITIEYSRPGVKDRVIFGDLVSYDKIWRTGANKCTRIDFSTDVKVHDSAVPAGSYCLFTIPGTAEWTVILTKDTELWGTGDYNVENDQARFTVKPKEAPFTESMMIDVNNIRDNSATINLVWEKTYISFPVTVNSQETALANIEASIKDLNNGFRVYNNAARYYLDNEMDAAQALTWAKKSADMDARFWNVFTLSKAYAANGHYDKAVEAAKKSRQLAVEAEYDVYIKRNDKNIEKWEGMR